MMSRGLLSTGATRAERGERLEPFPLYAMLSVYFAWYNFCLVHQTLRVAPAMEAGLTDHVWTIEEMLRYVGLK